MATDAAQDAQHQNGSAPAASVAATDVLIEGQGRIIKKGTDVFYNEAQVTNRDLSIAVLRHFLPQLAAELADGTLKRKPRPHPHNFPGAGGPWEPPAEEVAAEAAADVAAAAAAAAAASGGGGSEAQQQQAGAAAAGGSSSKGGNARAAGRLRILEGLAATGLRSIRYAKELQGELLERIDANDLDPTVVRSMRANIAFNGPEVSALVRPHCSDARLLMLLRPYAYDVVDLDPYGTPAHLLDAAVQAVADGGLLCVTATDMAVLCGNSGEVCWTKYGSYPLHRSYCHEGALRILLACIESHANRHKRYIAPLLAVHVDFYIRVFVRVYTSAAEIKHAASKQSYVWQSQGCDSWWLQPVGQVTQRGNSTKFMAANGPGVPAMRCPESGAGYLMGGPIWTRPLHDGAWVSGMLARLESEAGRYAQTARIRGLLTAVSEELHDVPLYYNVHEMCKVVRCTPPKGEALRSALLNAGFRVSGSHANPLALKTDAPPAVVWDVIRCWVKQHPVREPAPGSYAAAVLAKPVETQADFRRHAGAVPKSSAAGVAKFVQNPAFWGPKARHGRALTEEQQKQQRIQAEQHRERMAAAAAAAGGDGGGDAGAGSSGGAAAAAAAAAAAPAAAAAGAEAPMQLEGDWEEQLDELYGDDQGGDAAAGAGSGGKKQQGGRRPAKRTRQLAGAGAS